MTYVTGNLYGNYEKFKEMLSAISFKDTDILYVLGDSVDIGENSMELIGDMSVRYNVYSVMGEHDYLAAKCLFGFDKMLKNGGEPDGIYISNINKWMSMGGGDTLTAFRSLDEEMREGVLDYLTDMSLYDEVTVKGKTYVLVHKGIANFDPDLELDEYEPEDFITEPLDLTRKYYDDKTVITCHIDEGEGGGDKIFYGNNSICLALNDTDRIACLCLETGKEYYF